MSDRESSTATCPDCGRKQRFLADEWPDDCVCGHDWGRGEREREEQEEARAGMQHGIKCDDTFIAFFEEEEDRDVCMSVLSERHDDTKFEAVYIAGEDEDD